MPFLGAHPVEQKSTEAVTKMLSPETAEPQSMGMIDNCFWLVNHAISVVEPAPAKLPVLCCGQGIAGVEPADEVKLPGGHRQVIGSEKPCMKRIGIIVGMQIVNKHLAGGGTAVLPKDIDGVPADRTIR